MNTRTARKIVRQPWRYTVAQVDAAESRVRRYYHREELKLDVNAYHESRVVTARGDEVEVYAARVCLACRHLECPCCGGWCDDLSCLDRDHDRCTYALPARPDPIRVEPKQAGRDD